MPTISKSESHYQGQNFTPDYPGLNQPPTANPKPEDLKYEARPRAVLDVDKVIAEVTKAYTPPANAEHLNLAKSVQYAINKSLEYRVAEETYLLLALDLLIQQHIWSPRFFNKVSPQYQGVSLNGTQSTALQLVNDLGVSQNFHMVARSAQTFLRRPQSNSATRSTQAKQVHWILLFLSTSPCFVARDWSRKKI